MLVVGVEGHVWGRGWHQAKDMVPSSSDTQQQRAPRKPTLSPEVGGFCCFHHFSVPNSSWAQRPIPLPTAGPGHMWPKFFAGWAHRPRHTAFQVRP